ncbi:SsrA-binding protein SmpB [Alphaproteobacteria bacterium]|nr:SsrA-binding protein SmpB [Alphaproteobacteria bacterium]
MSILNRRAKFDYDLKETYIAGIVLQSNEVKPLRVGRASIQSSYISEIKGEIFVNNLEIITTKKNFDSKKIKTHTKLLLSKREIRKILGLLTTKGYTAVPMEIFFNEKGLAKMKFGVGIGKKKFDKRETIKERDWNRKKQRVLAK